MSAASPPLPAAHTVQIAGVQLAIRILVGAALVWLIVKHFGHRDPLWAMISVVIVSEAQLDAAVSAFRARALNTVIGCAIGLAFLHTLGTQSWSILLAMSVAVLISTSTTHTINAWRIAPVTVAIVMMPVILQGSRVGGTSIAITRTVGVLLGSAVAVMVSWAFFLVARALGPHERTSA
jgi:uncharacterized membrane protein YccC